MAYVSKQDKQNISTKINPILKQYGLQGSLSVRNHSTLNLTIFGGSIDFIGNFNEVNENDPRFVKATDNIQVNEYWYKEHFSGIALEVLEKLIPAMRTDDWFCDDDIQSDYFHRSYYYNVNIGRYDHPYKLKVNKMNNSEVVAENVVAENVVAENVVAENVVTDVVSEPVEDPVVEDYGFGSMSITELSETLTSLNNGVVQLMSINVEDDMVVSNIENMVNALNVEISQRFSTLSI